MLKRLLLAVTAAATLLLVTAQPARAEEKFLGKVTKIEMAGKDAKVATATLQDDTGATVVITHYQRLLDYIVPDFVHVLYNGRIVKSGDKSLALHLEDEGYDWVKEPAAAGAGA